MTPQRRIAAFLTGPGIRAARIIYRLPVADVLRVAALVELSAAAAADVLHILPCVADPADLYAVLGRGRWLPTMTRHIPQPPQVSSSAASWAVLAASFGLSAATWIALAAGRVHRDHYSPRRHGGFGVANADRG